MAEERRQALVEQKRRALVELRRQRPGPGSAAAAEPLTQVSRGGRLPLSFQQEGLWFLHQVHPTSTVYTIPFAWRLQGPLDTEALQAALTTVVARHEALRTRFDAIDGRPFQIIDPPPTRSPAPVTDLSHQPDPLAAASEHVQNEADRPFDLAAGGLFRAELIRLADRDHILTMAVHHIIADGWSIGILTRELGTLYNGTPLPPLTIQPADVAAWQRTSLRLNDQLAYWRNRLDGLPALDLPADRPRPAVRSGSGAGLSADIDAALGAAAADLAQAEEVSFLAVLLAAFLVVLARYTGQEDLVVGSVFGGRTRSELEPLVGYFASTLVLRTSLTGDPDFRALVRRCHDTVLGASAHQDVPFGLVVDALNPTREAGRNPLFQVSFSFQPASWSTGEFALGGIPAQPLPGGTTSQSRFDIAVAVSQRPDRRLLVWVEYATQLFDRSRMGRLVEHLELVLRQAVDDSGLRLSRFRLMTDAQAYRLIQEWNPTPVPRVGGELLGDLIHEQVRSRPQAPAIRYGDSEITYGELGRRAFRLAWTLRREWAVDAESVVAILLERGIDLIVAQLGVTLAGGAWLPLDPTHPTERLRYQLQDAGAVTVLTHRTLVDRLPPATNHLCLDQKPLTGRPEQPPPARTRPDHLAYLIYTSGSTGRPKGVLVTHRNVTDFLASARDLFALAPTDRVLQFASPTFDVSIFDTFATLASGALLICAPREQLHNPDHLTALLVREHITVAPLPPAVLARVDASAHLPNLRMIIVAGEACGPELVKRWSRPDVEFHNGYGPTEITVLCTSHRCVASEATVPIGQAMVNHRAYVLDATHSPVPIGIPGELYVAGTGVARGYLNHPALTAERFLPDPFTTQPGQRMYRTGDLVRWQDNGTLEFLGRTDRQIKIRGIRIEPGEIEQALLDHPDVRQAVLTTRGGDTLAAYVVTDPATPTDETALRAHLIDHLPTYLLPATITQLPALPYTTSGKVDHHRLPDPTAHPNHHREPAHTATEHALAAIWHDLLNIPTNQISTHDNFFTLGGNSLRAIQLISRIHDTLGHDLDLRQIYLDSTITGLAAAIDRRPTPGSAQPQPALLVPLRAGGTRPPLFCVHPVGGSAAPYLTLSGLLPADLPVYGLEAVGLHGGEPLPAVPEMAERYLPELLACQPDGPYHLLGWSAGGLIALELAARLRERRAPVAALILLDTVAPRPDDPLPDQAELLAHFAHDVAAQAGVAAPMLSLSAVPEGERAATVTKALEQAGLVPAGIEKQLEARMAVFIATSLAARTYRIASFDGSITLLTARERPDERVRLRPRFTRQIEVPGNHYTVLREPHVNTLAAVVASVLDAAV